MEYSLINTIECEAYRIEVWIHDATSDHGWVLKYRNGDLKDIARFEPFTRVYKTVVAMHISGY